MRNPILLNITIGGIIQQNFLTCFFLVCLLFINYSNSHSQTKNQSDSSRIVAGFRASEILDSYPNNQFPKADYWISVGKKMSQKFAKASPAGIWIVGMYQGNNIVQLRFPSNGNSYPFIEFSTSDVSETYLSRFDSAGVKIWLQVESGAANMDTLIGLVMNRYKHHSCVKGFGVDVEWFYEGTNVEGRKVTDSMAQHWEQKIKSIDTSYTLFLKHWIQSWMPPTYRGKILFVDDSQGFSDSLSQMMGEFKSWGTKFAPNNVAFQYGYPNDSTWWRHYADPTKTIGDALLLNIANTYGLFWVDFTVVKVFPLLPVHDIALLHSAPSAFLLEQNYPNPFNPSTVIGFQLPVTNYVTLKVFDLLGKEVITLVDEKKEAGKYQVSFDASRYTSSVYFYQLRTESFVETKKMALTK